MWSLFAISRRTRRSAGSNYRYALTSAFIFYTQAFNWIGMARKGQTFVNLWHGCGYKANKEQPQGIFLTTVWCQEMCLLRRRKSSLAAVPGSFLHLGYPRYDQMMKGSDAAKYKEKLESSWQWQAGSRGCLPTVMQATKRLNEETLNNEFNIPDPDDKERLFDFNNFCGSGRQWLAALRVYQLFDARFSGWVFENPLEYMPGRSYIYNVQQFRAVCSGCPKWKKMTMRINVRQFLQRLIITDNYCKLFWIISKLQYNRENTKAFFYMLQDLSQRRKPLQGWYITWKYIWITKIFLICWN